MKKCGKSRKNRKEGRPKRPLASADPPPAKDAQGDNGNQEAPPDIPPNKDEAVKKENEGVKCNGATKKVLNTKTSNAKTSKKKASSQSTVPLNNEETGARRSKTLCRDFKKGKCTRPETCRFSHKYDVSELVGTPNFCRNFQTTDCSRANCRYVHATANEEERFYMTGELPHHVSKHNKRVRRLPSLPPSPPTEVEDPILLELLREEAELRQRIEVIRNRLGRVKRTRLRKRNERHTLEKKRDNVLASLTTFLCPRLSLLEAEIQQKLLLDQLNEAVKRQTLASKTGRQRIVRPGREHKKMLFDQLNHAIKTKLAGKQDDNTKAFNIFDASSSFWATLDDPEEETKSSDDELGACGPLPGVQHHDRDDDNDFSPGNIIGSG